MIRLGLAGTFLLGIVQILTWGGSFFLIAILGGPIIRDTGWSPRWVYGALSVGILVSGLLSPLCGRLINRYGGRQLLGWSGIVIAAGLSVMALTDNLAVFIAAWGVIGVGMAMGLYDTLFAALGNLYGQDGHMRCRSLSPCQSPIKRLYGNAVGPRGWTMAKGF